MLDGFFTECCPACGGYGERGFCATCADELPRVRAPCAGCGLGRPVASCPRRAAAWHVDAVVAPFAFEPPLDHYVHALKYRGQRALGRAFALLLTPAVQRAAGDVDALVAVPLTRARARERGYNQAVEIARPLARALGLPLLQRGIVRRGDGASQTTLRADARWAGVANAFAVRRPLPALRVAIVDDVVTTGATVNALAAALRAAGASQCVAWSIARTPAEKSRSETKRVIEH